MAWLTQADRAFIQSKWLATVRRWTGFNLNSLLQSLGFFVLLAIFWYLCFQGVSRLCAQLYQTDIIGPILLARLLSVGFFAAFLIVVGGHVLTAFSALFRGSDLPRLIQAPYPLAHLYRIQCVETLIRGGWGLGLFCVPILLAYGVELGAPPEYYPITFIGLLGFLCIAGLTGILVMMFLARYVMGRPWRMFIGSFLVGGSFISLVLFTAITNSELFQSVEADRLGEILANMRFSNNPYLPSHWIASLMQTAQSRDYADVALYLSLLLASAFLLWCLVMETGLRWYGDAWLWAQEHVNLFEKSREASKKFTPKRFRWLPFILPRRVGAVISKEARLFSRDFSQWGQLLLILVLVLFYIAHMQNITFDDPQSQARNLLVFFNLILLGFIQATLSIRFSFPSISLEGKGFWVVKSSGASLPHFFFTKYYLHVAVLLVIGQSLGWILNSILGVDSTLKIISAVVLFLFSFGLTSWTMGLGAVFHRFEVTNAAEVSSDTGALITMIVTLIYFGLSIAFLALYAFYHTPGLNFSSQLALNREIIIYLTVYLLLQTGSILFPVQYGLEKLQKAEL